MLGDLLWFEGMEAKTQPEVLKAGKGTSDGKIRYFLRDRSVVGVTNRALTE
jgi:hypothetical protein